MANRAKLPARYTHLAPTTERAVGTLTHNQVALALVAKTGGGFHRGSRAEQDRKACRGRVRDW